MLVIDDMVDSVSEISQTEHNVNRINSIGSIYGEFRQESKTPTFALTYQGTYITLMANSGFSEAMARQIEQRYHELYAVSDKWIAGKLDQASVEGYITVAFGLRVRTPLLHQVVRGTSSTPYEAEAEGRSAGNALGQSYCLLNSRALTEFMNVVRAGEHRLEIRPMSQIHDASYFLIPDNVDILRYVNKHLVKAVEWQDDPAIYHPDVKLGGELSVFFPSWSYEAEIPNGASEDDVFDCIQTHLGKLDAKNIPY